MKTRRTTKYRDWSSSNEPCVLCGGVVNHFYAAICDECLKPKPWLPPWAWKLAAVLAGVYFVAIAIVCWLT
jgi:hypothetical protein